VRREICPVLDQSFPVRYRFENANALHAHLGPSNFFFIADPTLPGAPGARFIVEIEFERGEGRSLVRGRLCNRVRDGVWLDLAIAHTTAWWDSAASLHRRAWRRLGCDLFAEVRPEEGQPWFCRAVDLSEGGLRIDTGPFQSLLAGDRLAVTLISADPLVQPAEMQAQVAWAWGREAGMAIKSATSELHEMIAGVKWRWDAAPTVRHRDRCQCGARPGGQRHP
jgi:hypothetical protein